MRKTLLLVLVPPRFLNLSTESEEEAGDYYTLIKKFSVYFVQPLSPLPR